MSKHHVSLDTAQRLKAAGFPQENLYSWWKDDDNGEIIWIETDDDDSEWGYELLCAAPILTEVLERLPVKHGGDKLTIIKQHILKGGPESYSVGYGSIRPFAIRIGNPNPTEAAALLWLKLKEASDRPLATSA